MSRLVGELSRSAITINQELILLILLLLSTACFGDMRPDTDEGADEPQPEHYDGRSFFFLGTLFRRWRDRWMAFHNPSPLYAGPAFPLNGYYHCPAYGCNPAAIAPQPGSFYPAYYATLLPQHEQQQQQQHAQGNSNVYIYQTDQNVASSAGSTPYGPGYFGPARQPMPLGPAPPRPLPLPPPPATPLGPPPPPPPSVQAGASSYGFGSGPVPLPMPVCAANPLSCALG